MEPSSILVIDNERNIYEGCQLRLSDIGHSMDSYDTGEAGLKAILEGAYDVTLLAMKLPDMDGMDILRTVRKEKPNETIIVVTGYSTVQNAVESMKLGAFEYLCKPFSDDELVLAIARAIEKKRLVEENLSLRKELRDRFGYKNIVGTNPKILRIFEKIRKVAPMDSTVLLSGESGTGKEIFATAIHAHSHRSTRRFYAVDCSTISPSLLESELFGHVKGAFTGAVQDKAGIFEEAHRGTLFLDDVTNLSMETQGKLLRVLEMQEYKPVGSSRVKKTDVRIVAATNQDLKVMVKNRTFREDLFYRLDVFPIFLPPLRERKDDISKLAYHFLRLFCRKTGKQLNGFSNDALEMLINYEWPGNIRELKNVIEHLVIMEDKGSLDLVTMIEHLQMRRASWEADLTPGTLKELRAVKKHFLECKYGEVEKAFLIKALKDCDGNVTRAAERVGMQRPNFHSLMRKHGVLAGDAKSQGH
ncbi:sigma-54-dependent transcriptional regulator [Thermodesulfobacteriota bacterium]